MSVITSLLQNIRHFVLLQVRLLFTYDNVSGQMKPQQDPGTKTIFCLNLDAEYQKDDSVRIRS